MGLPVHIAASDAAKIDDFYRTISSISFTLLGLWWLVAQVK